MIAEAVGDPRRAAPARRLLPAAIGDVGWALLLDAFAARLEGRGVAMTSIGAPAGIPRSTAHRWALHLLEPRPARPPDR